MRPIGKKPNTWILISTHLLLRLQYGIRTVCINCPLPYQATPHLVLSAGATTAQAKDTDCTVFSINQMGIKSASRLPFCYREYRFWPLPAPSSRGFALITTNDPVIGAAPVWWLLLFFNLPVTKLASALLPVGWLTI